MPTINIRWADNTEELRNHLKQGLDQIEATRASAEKMARSLGGENLIRAANNYVAAVNLAGGANKLTADRQEQVNRVITKAIEQYRVLGKEAPKAMLDLAEATKQASAPTDTLSSSLAGMGKDILSTAAGFVTAQAAIAGLKSGIHALTGEVENLVMHGSAVSDVTANFDRLTSQAGMLGSTLLGALRNGTHQTVADFELMKTVNQDLAAGMRLTDQQFGTLAKGAFALAQATGTDVKTALDTMNDAMLTGRTRALALLTGKIDLSAAEEKFAASIGTTADKLNDEGKLEAARAAILDGVSAATARLGDQVDGLDEHVAQAQVSWENFHNELAKTVAESPVLEAAFGAIQQAIADALGADQKNLVTAVAGAIDDAAIAAVGFAKVGVTAGSAVAVEMIALYKVLGDIAQIIDLVALGFKGASLAAAEFFSIGGRAGPMADDVARIGKEIDMITERITARGKNLQGADALQLRLGDTSDILKSLDDVRAKMIAARESAASFVGPLQDVASAHTAAATAAGIHSDFTKKSTKDTTDAAAAQKAFKQNLEEVIETAKGYQSIVDTIDGSVVEAIRHYREQGVSLDRLATMYGLTKVQVEGLTQAFKLEEEALKRIAALNAANAAPTVAQPHFEVAQGELPGLVQIRAYVKEVEHAKAVEAELGQRGALGIEKIGEAANEAAPKARDLFDSLRSLAHLDLKSVASDIGSFFKGGLKSIGTGILEGFGNQIAGLISDLVDKGIQALWGGIKRLFGGPSAAELAGRGIVEAFQSQFASVEDMINRVGAAYVANGKTAAQAQAAIQRLWAAEKQGAEATKRALEEINEVLKRQQEITDAIHGEGFQSQDEIRHAADIANAAYEEMLRSGQYTAEQVDAAYRHYQELLAQLEGAAGEAARAWLEAHKSADDAVQASSDAMKSAEADLKGLIDKRNALAAGLAKEAPEQIMGVIETQQRGELAALDAEIKAKADAYAKLADETGQKMADAIVEALRNIHIDPIHAEVVLDYPPLPPGARTANGEQPEPAARGGRVSQSGISYFAGGYMPSFRPIGTDIIPAMLTPGEMVLTASQQAAIGSLLAQSPSRSGGVGGGGVTVQFGDIHIQATGADMEDIESFAPKFNEGVRRNVGGMLTVLQNVAKRAGA